MFTTLLLLLISCVAPLEERSVSLRQAPPPMPGSEALRISEPEAEVGQRFDATHPLVFEFQVPPGVILPGRGLPPDLAGPPPLAAAYGPADDESVVQLELPLHRTHEVDEDPDVGRLGSFDPPRFCALQNNACLWGDDDDGRWRAWRVRDDGGVVTETELQLAHTFSDDYGNALFPALRVVGLWHDAAAAPLDELDRIRFEYVGHVPRRATWNGPWRPRLRYRPESAPLPCPAAQRDCWVELDPSDVQPMEHRAGPPAALVVVAPLDAEVGQPATLRVISLDAWSNPSPLTGNATFSVAGRAVTTVPFRGTWFATTTVTPPRPGLVELRATHPAVGHSIAQPVSVTVGPPRWRRLVGDIHAHSGNHNADTFSSASSLGDHRGNFLRAEDALAYAREVVALDFAAISEHAAPYDGWSVPPHLTDFLPGGRCAVDPTPYLPAGDWWVESQTAAWSYQQAHPGFVTFPAYEWHGNYVTPQLQAPLHRIVLHRDHDPVTPWGLPMLPGNTNNRMPACLHAWLEGNGLTPDDVTVIPHMMAPNVNNRDWDLTYAPPPAFRATAPDIDPAPWIRVGEIFSSRNLRDADTTGQDVLTLFEGDTMGTQPRYAFRYGWRDTEATIGVIAASDNHSGTPGSDDFWPTGGTPQHQHEPGGYAVVLTDPAQPTRDGIFDALLARRTYGTTAHRAWLDVVATTPTGSFPMGSEIDVHTCGLSLGVQLATPMPVRTLEVYTGHVGTRDPYRLLLREQRVNRTTVNRSLRVSNPVAPGGPPERWLYVVRAFSGRTVAARGNAAEIANNQQDAVWASPIWVTWHDGGCLLP